MNNKFLLIHSLIDVGINNSNRDDVGEVKSAIVGGRVRQRRSSQSKKRADRDAMVEIGEAPAYRSRRLADKLYKDLVAQGIDSKTALDRLGDLFAKGKKDKGKLIKDYAKLVKDGVSGELQTETLIFYSQNEYELMLETLKNDTEEVQDIQKLLAEGSKRYGGLIALFGRMMADHPLMNVDAAVQYSHGFSTHEISMESDYFTALDDLGEDPGAAHLDQTSFTQSVLFTSVAVDLKQLQKNLPDTDKADLTKLLVSFVEAHLTATPEGKKNSFFSSSLPQMAMVDVTNLPISMHGAFEKPIRASAEGGYMENSIKAFTEHRNQMMQRGYNVEQTIGGENYSLQAIKDFVAQVL